MSDLQVVSHSALSEEQSRLIAGLETLALCHDEKSALSNLETALIQVTLTDTGDAPVDVQTPNVHSPHEIPGLSPEMEMSVESDDSGVSMLDRAGEALMDQDEPSSSSSSEKVHSARRSRSLAKIAFRSGNVSKRTVRKGNHCQIPDLSSQSEIERRWADLNNLAVWSGRRKWTSTYRRKYSPMASYIFQRAIQTEPEFVHPHQSE